MTNEELTQLIKKYPYIAGAVGAILIVFVFWMILPDNDAANEAKLAQLDRAIQVLDYNEAQGKSLAGDINKMSDTIQKIASNLLDPEDTTKVFSYFIDLEKSSKVTMADPVQLEVTRPIQTKAMAKIDAAPPIDTVIVKYQLRLTGRLSQVMRFIQGLDRGNYYARVTSFNMTRNPGVNTGEVEATLTVDILGQRSA